MSDDDPFAEPNDTERTVIRPNPAGRRPSVAPAPPAQPFGMPQPQPRDTPEPRRSDAGMDAALTGMNPLNAAASTLFSLVSRIRNRAQHLDPEALRRSVVAEVRGFESRALQARVDAQDVKVARYAICATLDDVVLNTPWGGTSIWAQQSMVGTFHRETVGGDRFYDVLARLEQDPGRNIELLEFMFVCLSLGFEGRLRVEQGGHDKHANIRAGLAKIIRTQRGEVDRDLSPHWPGLDKPHRVLSAWKPFLIALGAVAALLGSGFVGLSFALSSQTERLLGQVSTLTPGGVATLERRAPPVVAPEPTPEDTVQLDKVAEFLKAEIDEGLVAVFQDANTITVRIKGSGMFGSGSDKLKAAFDVPLQRVANALKDTDEPVIIVGHSDNQPINSARFPSNMHLSLARAESVKKTLAKALGDDKRLTAEGRADKEPLVSNDSAEGRATNRRIEIVLVREKSE
ncbi:type VI secretion system protein TssL, long form [Paracoccaceae bacterium Fryx2]|nr:type VI secretion system protein TssL, long form [Paracoccaceae bacterium Fryx2]